MSKHLCAVVLVGIWSTAIAPTNASTLLTNARIIDGSGTPAFEGAVRIEGDRIIAIGELEAITGERVIDVEGLSLAPGFIDTHSHHGEGLQTNRDALPLLSQGITTIVLGQDGGHEFPLAETFTEYEEHPASVNIASYVGHNTIRHLVMGEDFKRHATNDELTSMRALLKKELAAGALGLSTGLEYEPSLHSSAEEVLVLAQHTADAGGRYISHIRSEDRYFWEAIDEIVSIGKTTGMPVQISHLKLAAKASWGETARLLDRLDKARTEGVHITADIYPYEYWESTIWVLLPDRNADDLEEIQFVLDELTPADGIIFTDYKPNPSYVGKTIEEIAVTKGLGEAETISILMKESAAWSANHDGKTAESIMGRSMRDEDIAALLAWPHINLCTDGSYTGHPRGSGAFPRVFAHFVRQMNALDVAAAVQRMTSNAARNMGFEDRGIIRVGAIADLVLFDPKSIRDHASLQNPQALSEGIVKVWVTGTLVFDNGTTTDARPGRVLRREGKI
ncbi:MAG: D-aminoacylase [Gammaproteobacteria bacterium]|nr:D-aminoacylase [Gammaproteobacteria bacterium]